MVALKEYFEEENASSFEQVEIPDAPSHIVVCDNGMLLEFEGDELGAF